MKVKNLVIYFNSDIGERVELEQAEMFVERSIQWPCIEVWTKTPDGENAVSVYPLSDVTGYRYVMDNTRATFA